MKLTKHQMFLDSVHEIGHLLGLPHNPDETSVMFSFGLEKGASLDAADLDILAARHQLRAQISSQHRGMKEIRVTEPVTKHGHSPTDAGF